MEEKYDEADKLLRLWEVFLNKEVKEQWILGL